MVVGTPVLGVGSWYGHAPGLLDQLEDEALWQLKDRSFSQVTRELGIDYGTLRRILEREIDEETLGFIEYKDELYLGIDESIASVIRSWYIP